MNWVLVIGVIVVIIIIIGLGIGLYYLLKKEQEEIVPAPIPVPTPVPIPVPPEPDATFCLAYTEISYFDTAPAPYIAPPSKPYTGYIITKGSTCSTEHNTQDFTFKGYNEEVEGTKAWCVSNLYPNPNINVIADHSHLTPNVTSCKNQNLVMFLPKSLDFAPGLIQIYVYSIVVSGTAGSARVDFKVNQFYKTKQTNPNLTLEYVLYAFP